MGSLLLPQTQAEVALAAADGDPSVAIEILMNQQACIILLYSWIQSSCLNLSFVFFFI